MPIPPLPVELLLQIFTLFHPAADSWISRRTLRSCALVCRDWRDPAQRALHHSPTLGNSRTGGWVPRMAETFIRTITSEPHLASFVQSLTIHFPYVADFDRERGDIQHGVWQDHWYTLTDAERIAHYNQADEGEAIRESYQAARQDDTDRRVREEYAVALDDAGVNGWPSGLRGGLLELKELFKSLPNLKKLKLWQFQLWHELLDEPHDLYWPTETERIAIGPLTSLLHLYIKTNSTINPVADHQPNTLLFHTPNLETLRLDVGVHLIPASTLDLPRLHTINLRIYSSTPTFFRDIVLLISASIQSLRNLTLHVPGGTGSRLEGQLVPTLARATHLESLSMADGFNYRDSTGQAPQEGGLLPFLQQSSLRHLSLRTRPSPLLLASLPTTISSLVLVRNDRSHLGITDPSVDQCVRWILEAKAERLGKLDDVVIKTWGESNQAPDGMEGLVKMASNRGIVLIVS